MGSFFQTKTGQFLKTMLLTMVQCAKCAHKK